MPSLSATSGSNESGRSHGCAMFCNLPITSGLKAALRIRTTLPYKISIYYVRFAFTRTFPARSDQWMQYQQLVEKLYTCEEYRRTRYLASAVQLWKRDL